MFASGCPRNRDKKPCDLCEKMEPVHSYFVVPVEPDRATIVSLPPHIFSNGKFSNMPKSAQHPLAAQLA
jgi:hypothetical protein